ncbi:MAG: hypothetical protein KF797_06290 [Flavobacteriales bacterium]|nr:hypothetical protein [Flavobacteriales bacterium]
MTTTKESRVHIADLHSDHKLWLNALEFYKQEVGLLENRIADIAQRNTAQEVMAELEHFQNQYIRQKEVIDTLRNKINHHHDDLEREYKERPVAIEHRLFNDHTAMRDEMDTFEKLYRELKEELFRWLAKWM